MLRRVRNRVAPPLIFYCNYRMCFVFKAGNVCVSAAAEPEGGIILAWGAGFCFRGVCVLSIYKSGEYLPKSLLTSISAKNRAPSLPSGKITLRPEVKFERNIYFSQPFSKFQLTQLKNLLHQKLSRVLSRTRAFAI